MTEEKKPYKPKHPGVIEHFQRAVLFYNTAKGAPEIKSQFRVLMAAVYSCRAIYELIFEHARDPKWSADKVGEMSINRDELKAIFEAKVRHFALVERLRIHDFHRHGIQAPIPGWNVQRGAGPIKLKANKGAAYLTQTANGPERIVTGNSKIEEQRSLFEDNGRFFDEKTEEYVELHRIVSDYLTDISDAVEESEKYYLNPGAMFPTPFEEMFGDTDEPGDNAA
jgi:hypothetical protein